MHILLFHFYSNNPNPVYQEISAALRLRGHTVWVGQPDEDGNLIWLDGDQIVKKIDGIKTNIDSSPKGFANKLRKRVDSFTFALRVRRFLKELKPDVLQANFALYCWLFPIFMPEKTRFFFDIRQINESFTKSQKIKIREWMRLWEIRLISRFFYPRTFFCHQGAAERILGRYWQQRSSIVPIGLDESFLSIEPKDINRQDEYVRFIYIGRISHFRNLETIFSAIQRVIQKTDKFSVTLIGPDDADGFYQNLAKEMGIDSVVQVRDPIDYKDIPELVLEYDVGFAYVPDRPTWHYQPAIKVLEYRALGMPIISTDVKSHREQVTDGVNGLLVQDNVDSLAEAIERFIIDKTFLKQCRINAREMRKGESWADVAKMYENDYLLSKDTA